MTMLCLMVAGVLLAVLTKSQTKIFWYLAPATPFLALAVGLGLSDGLAWVRNRERSPRTVLQLRIAYAAVVALFVIANLGAVYYYQVGVERKLSSTNMEGRYGPFLEEIRQSNRTRDLIVLDEGSNEARAMISQNPEFAHYSPEAEFFANVEDAHGMRVRVMVPGQSLPPGTWIATCDPRSNTWLTQRYEVDVALRSGSWCAFEETRGVKTASLSLESGDRHSAPRQSLP